MFSNLTFLWTRGNCAAMKRGEIRPFQKLWLKKHPTIPFIASL
jgi:hypothetical protein